MRRLGSCDLPHRAALLTVVLTGYLAVVAPIAWLLADRSGLVAAVVATVICLAAACFALLLTTLVAPPEKPTAHVLVGMAVRMGLPLFACLLVTQGAQQLVNAGFVWYLLGAFLLVLLLETLMAVGQLQTHQSSR